MQQRPKAVAERWLLHAERDLGFGQLGLEAGGYFTQICFLAQQSAEKALKALLYLRGARMVQERSISDLLQRVVDVHPRLSRYHDMAEQLDQYYLAFRNPDSQPGSASYETIDESQAKEAIDQGQNLILEVRNLIRLGR